MEKESLTLETFRDRLTYLCEGGFEVVSNLLFYLTDENDNGELSTQEVTRSSRVRS